MQILIIRKLKGRIHIEYLDVDEREISNRILKIRDMSVWAERFKIRSNCGVLRIQRNETSGFTEDREIIFMRKSASSFSSRSLLHVNRK
jgi:hypothetical protein